ncbi:MAG: glycosyltransferase family 9 protein [Acidobacteria bacterium]|nr:glycosyltransferase family 9 protein [Acidobacteriota bacterium]MYK90325.1 glycosyltransferase family 9 protein [Acidobacteriota bacterium]
MFDHLQIQDWRERWLVGCADAALAPLAAMNGWRRGPAPKAPPRRVLLLRLERIGDLLMTLDAIRAVRERAPAAEIRLAVGSWNAELARLLPAVDRVETIDAPWLSQEGTRSSPREVAARILGWRRDELDLAVNFEPDVRSNALLAASGARRRIGYDTGGGGGFLTGALRYDRAMHTATNALRLVDRALPAGGGTLGSAGGLALGIPEGAETRAARLLESHDSRRPLVGINPGAGRAIKEWPAPCFAAAAAALAEQDAATIVLLGSASETATAAAVRDALPPHVRLVDLAGDAPLVDLAAVLRRLSVLLTADTGPMHLAAAVGTPVVGIFGPSDPVRYAPLSRRSAVVCADLWCRPCGRMRRPPRRCEHGTPDCLSGIHVDAVVDAARRLLHESRRDH